jgi:hypothetical protein
MQELCAMQVPQAMQELCATVALILGVFLLELTLLPVWFNVHAAYLLFALGAYAWKEMFHSNPFAGTLQQPDGAKKRTATTPLNDVKPNKYIKAQSKARRGSPNKYIKNGKICPPFLDYRGFMEQIAQLAAGILNRSTTPKNSTTSRKNSLTKWIALMIVRPSCTYIIRNISSHVA